MLLELADVRGGYGGADILHGVSLEVGEREIVTIAGTNGAGKSTLAKAVVGLLPRVAGRIAFAAPISQDARSRTGSPTASATSRSPTCFLR
jgi:branched-chain amino acid transport system ATP-binding protein